MKILLCSIGRRLEFIKMIKARLGANVLLYGTDCSELAPAIYGVDKFFLTPIIYDDNYIRTVLDICIDNHINVITSLIDPEIEILSQNKPLFDDYGILVLAPSVKDAKVCLDKYAFYNLMKDHGIKTIKTYDSFLDFNIDLEKDQISFPVFVKPRFGSASSGIERVNTLERLKSVLNVKTDLIIQEFMDAVDIDVDAYIDTISGELVSLFSKKKLETKIGGASKTISFFDSNLVNYIQSIVKIFDFKGPIDIDVFYKNGEYYVSEINPRFGGAYIHALSCGVDFIELIIRNFHGLKNVPNIGGFEENVIMLMYDAIILVKNGEIFK